MTQNSNIGPPTVHRDFFFEYPFHNNNS